MALPAADTEAGRETFQSTCAVCHGQAGGPDPDSAVVQGLGVVPADFSDPLFNSREPATDWKMVVKHGGDALGLAPQMPPHANALSDAQIEEVVAYIKTLADCPCRLFVHIDFAGLSTVGLPNGVGFAPAP